ncbi:NfeD family protein [Atlantibacter sp.]|uniref:NfeD family protein n=1 Tax=Atlantibacter sp. TaxID=1903473 RepID=UPI0028A0C445|nr:NfeD family protein [Atlantibacter sp.]
MMAFFLAHPHTFWLSLGGVLLAAEMLGGSGYLLWSGVAAVVTGLLVWLIPFGWEWQGLCFAVLTVIAALLWSRWLGRKPQPHADAVLNQRGQQLIGQRFILDSALINGRGHMRVGDGTWPVVANDDIPAGTRVEVIAVEGITLRVRPSPP